MPCKLIVTGFGPFQGVERNPTSDLVQLLEDYGHKLAEGCLGLIETHVLEVSALSVKQFLESEVYETHQCAQRPTVVVHLGVDTKAERLRLEWQAFNDATFRVPDEDGWQPDHKVIDSSLQHPWGTRLITKLPISLIVESLQQKGYPVQSSQDAGRFVCNWTYYVSLQHCKHHTKPPPAAARLPANSPQACNLNQHDNSCTEIALCESAGTHRHSLDSWQVVTCPQDYSSSVPVATTMYATVAGLDRECSREIDASGGGAWQADQKALHGQTPEQQEAHAPMYALFVHVPPFTVVHKRVQFEFLLDLLQELVHCVGEGHEVLAHELPEIGEGDGGRAADGQLNCSLTGMAMQQPDAAVDRQMFMGVPGEPTAGVEEAVFSSQGLKDSGSMLRSAAVG